MTKAELLKLLEPLDDNLEVFVFDGEFEVWTKAVRVEERPLAKLPDDTDRYVEQDSYPYQYGESIVPDVKVICIL